MLVLAHKHILPTTHDDPVEIYNIYRVFLVTFCPNILKLELVSELLLRVANPVTEKAVCGTILNDDLKVYVKVFKARPLSAILKLSRSRELYRLWCLCDRVWVSIEDRLLGWIIAQEHKLLACFYNY